MAATAIGTPPPAPVDPPGPAGSAGTAGVPAQPGDEPVGRTQIVWLPPVSGVVTESTRLAGSYACDHESAASLVSTAQPSG